MNFNNIVHSSDFGVYTDTKYIQESKGLHITRDVQKTGGGAIAQIKLKNKSKQSIKINSVVVADFKANIEVKEVLEHGWLQSSLSQYKNLNQPTKKNKFFLLRDQNQFSFKKEYGYLTNSIISEWFTVIKLPRNNIVVGAITTAHQFSQIFMRKESTGVRVRVTCQFDALSLKPGQTFETEKIAFLSSLERFADLTAQSMNVKVKPPIKAMCCSYYWRGNFVSDQIINNELDTIAKLPEKLNLDYIQIDAGYSKIWGDWLDYKDRFPNGMSNIVKKIHEHGYKAGIWLAPFTANPQSKIFKDHPNWFLKNKGKYFEARYTSPFDGIIPNLRFRALDPTNKDFQKYLLKVLAHFQEAGFELFKLDFLYPSCLSTNYSTKMTRAQALHQGVKLIRDYLGSGTHVVSGITQLSPLVGLVDSARIGPDTLNPYISKLPILRNTNNQMLKYNLINSQNRSFMNGKLWVNDADCVIIAGKTGLSRKLIEEHKKTTNYTSKWIGDSLVNLTHNQKYELINYLK